MRRWHWIALAVCVAATVVVVIQSKRIRNGATATGALVAEAAETRSDDRPDFSRIESSDEARELARLRNEVAQLRSEKKQLQAARNENAQLNAAMTNETVTPGPERPRGFVAKENLANLGYATPADTVQTFFWAMREGNFDVLVDSFAPGSKERQRFEQMPPEQQEKMRRKMSDPRWAGEIAQLNDVGVREQESVSDNLIAVHVGSSISTNTVRMRLEQTPEGWKLHDPGF